VLEFSSQKNELSFSLNEIFLILIKKKHTNSQKKLPRPTGSQRHDAIPTTFRIIRVKRLVSPLAALSLVRRSVGLSSGWVITTAFNSAIGHTEHGSSETYFRWFLARLVWIELASNLVVLGIVAGMCVSILLRETLVTLAQITLAGVGIVVALNGVATGVFYVPIFA